jgi:glutaredoxin
VTTPNLPADLPAPPRASDPEARIVYLTRPGCHLCDVALPTVWAEADRAGTTVEVLDIDQDEALRADWNEQVPVVVVDGKVHARYEVDAAALHKALARRPLWRRLLRR